MKILARLSSFAILAAALVAVQAQPAVQDEGSYEARLTDVKGEVTVFTAEEPDGVPGDKDLPLAAGDKVRTGESSSAEITLSGEHCVSLRSNSELTLASLKRQNSELSLSLGSLLAKVQTLVNGDFRVRTPAAVAAVRGTEFGVEVDAGHPDQTHVGVFDEGRVAVTGLTGAPELLKANQETSVQRGGHALLAYQLRRFVRQRQFMRTAFRKRVQSLRQNWRAMSSAQRRAARAQMLARLRQVRREKVEKLQNRVHKAKEKSRRQRQDQEKMERFKQSIRDRRGRGG